MKSGRPIRNHSLYWLTAGRTDRSIVISINKTNIMPWFDRNVRSSRICSDEFVSIQLCICLSVQYLSCKTIQRISIKFGIADGRLTLFI
jgi:hypothetical protein